ncbi:MAG: alpha/beta hydrolase [Clostridia bacterium]|nr:alpha/beta hydrolase [Clostridia bacterium]
MIFKTVPLRNNDAEVSLDAYIADQYQTNRRKAILVIPGGGYEKVCVDREGEPVALAFLPYGYNAFVLKYSVGRKRPFPAQLIEAATAIKHIKDHADTYGIDPEEVFVVGFSAGGHLTGSCGILWNHPAIYEALDMPFGYNKPKGIMPIYPVVNGHADSFKNLWCTDTPSEEQCKQTYLNLHVDGNSAPAFILHTATDGTVPVQDSFDLANAYAKAGIPFELHIYPKGPHGMALANEITAYNGNPDYVNPEIAKWVGMAAAWANNL